MKKFFDTFEEAWQFLEKHPGNKLRWVAKIAKWVVTIITTYIIFV